MKERVITINDEKIRKYVEETIGNHTSDINVKSPLSLRNMMGNDIQEFIDKADEETLMKCILTSIGSIMGQLRQAKEKK